MKTTNADVLKMIDRLQELIQGGEIDSSDIEVNEYLDIDEYLQGMYNGLEIAISLLEDRDMKFRV